jgi:hypothetical protein
MTLHGRERDCNVKYGMCVREALSTEVGIHREIILSRGNSPAKSMAANPRTLVIWDLTNEDTIRQYTIDDIIGEVEKASAPMTIIYLCTLHSQQAAQLERYVFLPIEYLVVFIWCTCIYLI